MLRRTALALAFTLTPLAALAQQDVQLKPGLSALWGADYGGNVVNQYNTASPTSVVDSFRWYQGIYPADRVPLLDLTPTGAIFGTATGGSKGAGTVNATGFYVNGSALSGSPGGTPGQIQYNNAGAFGGFTTSGDAAINTSTGALTLATVNTNTGTWGSATLCAAFTTNGKGLITAAAQSACTPALANITGMGTGVAAALALNVGSAGAPVLFNGAGGTPSSIVLTNATGTASGLTAGNVTTNANLTGAVTSVGNATSLGSFSSANLRGALTDESGTGAAYFQGGDIGTPSAGVFTNITGTCTACTANTFTAGSATNLTSGTLPAARTNGHMNGTATNDNAAAGEVSEYVSCTVLVGSAVALTTGTAANICSISLTAGDWNVWGTIDGNAAGTTDITQILGWISTTSATLPTFPNNGALIGLNYPATTHVGLNDHFPVGQTRISVNATTTVYLTMRVTFTVSTYGGYGFMGARRAR